jgi:glycosyltransferase involved in cell wall biosynthesis
MERAIKPRVLIIGLTWPEPRATAAGVRTFQLIRFFTSRGYAVSLSSAAGEPPAETDPEISEVPFVPIRINHPSFDELISSLAPEIVVFDRFLTEEYFGWRVVEKAPNAIRILDTQDLHSLRQNREEALLEGSSLTPAQWKKSDITKREMASLFRCDLSLIISAFEIEWLQKNLPIDPSFLFYLPFVFRVGDEIPEKERLPFEGRRDFVFTGNGRHKANTDAILFLKEEIWPGIRSVLPDARMLVYGAHLPREITSLTDSDQGFLVRGWVPEIREVVKVARVHLMPLRFGAGLKGKLFEAILCGTPSVMTSVGAEGTAFSDLQSVVSDDTSGFISRAIKLYSSETLWKEIQVKSDTIVRSDFARDAFHDRLQQKLLTLRENLTTSRENNLIGGILLHHTTAGSKYLSKWIELKESNKATGQ